MLINDFRDSEASVRLNLDSGIVVEFKSVGAIRVFQGLATIESH